MRKESTDWLLVEEIENGDDNAFDELMRRYKCPVISFIYRMIGDAHEAEDLAQEVFVKAYRSIRRRKVHRAASRFSTWLFQIARNATLDHLRRRKRRPSESLTAVEERGGAQPGSQRTAVEEMASREIGEQIAEAVALLPEDQRAALALAEYEGFSASEIAATMQCSEKSVEGRLYRARQSLRQRLSHLLT